MAPIRTCRSGQRGAALVEFALVLPLLLIVIAGIVDFGFAFQRYEVVTNAAREGARMGVLPSAYTTAEIQTRVREYIRNGLSLSQTALDTVVPAANVVVTYPDLTVGSIGGTAVTIETVNVDVTYNHPWLLLRPVLSLINANWGTTIALRATSQMRREPGSGTGS